MSEWREWRLGALVDAAGGHIKTGPFGSQLHAHEYTTEPGGVPVVMPKDMVGGRVERRSVSRVDSATAERLKAHYLASGDVVLARRGDVGRFAFVEDDEAGWLCGTGSMRVHAPDHTVVLPRFLRYALDEPRVAEWLIGQSVGSTMPNLNAKIVSGLPLLLPDPPTQRRIAAILSAFDTLIEINERRIEVLEDLARSLYREWVVRFRFPGHQQVTLVDSEVGAIPEGWEVRRLRDFVSTQYGFTASADEAPVGPKFLRGMDINKRSFVDWSAVPYCEADEKQETTFKLEVGDVCVIRMANPGKVGIVERPIDAVFASYLVRLRSSEPRVPPYLLFHHLEAPEYQSWISGSSTGSTRKSASAGVLTEPQVVVPPLEVAALFEARVEVLRGELATRLEQSADLAATRDLLLPRLVTGRLDIADLDLGDLLPFEAA